MTTAALVGPTIWVIFAFIIIIILSIISGDDNYDNDSGDHRTPGDYDDNEDNCDIGSFNNVGAYSQFISILPKAKHSHLIIIIIIILNGDN